jgi:beta-glucosidase/6-phospho-beta-glucosidase/beta-galactosidase
MKITFPEDFVFGTSTAAAQIETAYDHDWQHLKPAMAKYLIAQPITNNA